MIHDYDELARVVEHLDGIPGLNCDDHFNRKDQAVSYSLKIAKMFKDGMSRKHIAIILGVSLTKVDSAIRRYVMPGGKTRK